MFIDLGSLLRTCLILEIEGDGPLKGEEGNSGADVSSLLHTKHSTLNLSGLRAVEGPLKFKTGPLVSRSSLNPFEVLLHLQPVGGRSVCGIKLPLKVS